MAEKYTHPIPLNVWDQHTIILGKTGAGKSSAMRTILEQFLRIGRRVAVLDPKGDHYGIVSDASGKGPGYPVVLFGDFKMDGIKERIPISPSSGKEIADLITSGNRPCVIGFYGWHVSDRTQFFIDFAGRLFAKNRSPLWLCPTEVHLFAPQGAVLNPKAGECLHWMNRLASEGRGLGINLLMDSQRPAKVHKDTLTSAETLVAMRVTHPRDRKAYLEWIEGCGDNEQSAKELMQSLAAMKRGDSITWSPEVGYFERVSFPMFKTYDSFKPPSGKESHLTQKGWANVDLTDVREKLAKTIEEHRQNDPRELKREKAQLVAEITKLKAELETAKSRPTKLQPVKQIDTRAVERTLKEQVAAERMKLKRQIVSYFTGEFVQRMRAVQAAVDALEQSKPIFNFGDDEYLNSFRRDLEKLKTPLDHVSHVAVNPPPRTNAANDIAPNVDGLAKGEGLVLNAVAQYPKGMSRKQITVVTKYKRRTRDAYIQRLSSKGYVTVQGDIVTATPAGTGALGNALQPLPVGEELIEHWKRTLPLGEGQIFTYVLGHYPKPVNRESITEGLPQYQRRTRDAYIQRLCARQIMETVGVGMVKISDELFSVGRGE